MHVRHAAIIVATTLLIAQTNAPLVTGRDLINLATAELESRGYGTDRYNKVESYCELDFCTVIFIDTRTKEIDDFTFINVTINRQTKQATVEAGIINK